MSNPNNIDGMAKLLHLKLPMRFVFFLLVIATLGTARTVYAVGSCEAIFAVGSRVGESWSRYEIEDSNSFSHVDQVFETAKKAFGRVDPLYKHWGRQLSVGPNRVYRGMRIRPSDISNILINGLEFSRLSEGMRGIYGAPDPTTPLGYALTGGGFGDSRAERRLGVLFEIDLTNLKFLDESIGGGPANVVIQENVPASAIKRMLIFDPLRDPLDFPWVDLK